MSISEQRIMLEAGVDVDAIENANLPVLASEHSNQKTKQQMHW